MNTASTDALRREVWGKELYIDAAKNMFFYGKNDGMGGPDGYGLMGPGPGYVIQTKDELSKEKGDTVTIALTAKLSGAGVTGDAEMEGNEEGITPYSEQIAISLKRNAVRLTGTLDEQKNAYDMRNDAKIKLKTWLSEWQEQQIFLKLGGVANTSLTDVNGVVIGADAAWSNTVDEASDTETNLGYGARYLCADQASGATSLASTDLITPQLISQLKAKARSANPKIRPIRIDGENYYVMFLHPNQAFDLKYNATFAQAMREAETRGKENPIFTGALGIWDKVILWEHEMCPFLDISVAGNNFGSSNSGTDYAAVDCYRAILCGAQAVAVVNCGYDKKWVEKSFDYDNQFGVSTGFLGGIQKIQFNSKDYGVAYLDTASSL